MNRFCTSSYFGRIVLSILILLFVSSHRTFAQTSDDFQRIYPRPVADVKTAVQKQKASSRGRLPTLEGFVAEQTSPSLDRYDRGFYECTFDIAPAVGGGTIVTVTTKVTAFLNDTTTGVSGYRVLVSNGRLENDALDRIEETLMPGAIPQVKDPSDAPAKDSQGGGGVRPSYNFNALGPAYGNAPVAAGASGESSSRGGSGPDTTRAPRTPVAPAMALPSGESLETLRGREATDAKKTQDLTAYIRDLEEVQRNQSRPANLAAVRKPRTPVYAKGVEGAPVLMNADAEDEFEVLEVSGPWVHVRISGASRGWIRRAQLEMPADYGQAAVSKELNTPKDAQIFKTSKEETIPFTGQWDKLKGKTVRVEWIEASLPTTSAADKLTFAKSVFLDAYHNQGAATEKVEGIVVVFDSADGGQISAPLASVKALADGSLSDTAFWLQCSLDPPESFQVSGK